MPDPQQRWPDDMPLEAQLGNALGLALAFLKSGDWNNQDMARIEAPFKAWCDQVVDGPAVPEGREPASVVSEPSDEELLEKGPSLEEVEELCEEHCFNVEGYESLECLQGLINDALARWGTPNQAEIGSSLGAAPATAPAVEVEVGS